MTRTLRIEGTGFTLDDEPFDMWGIRLANALENDRISASLIDVLDDYVEYGVNTFSVFLQGGSTGAANPFDADGTFTSHTRRKECSGFFKGRADVEGLCERNQVMDRLARVIEEADGRAMVVNLGVFYQARINQLTNDAAIMEATRNVARWLATKDYRNICVDLVNEYGHPGFEERSLCYGRAERHATDAGDELLEAFKAIVPHIPASISPCGNVVLDFDAADFVLTHSPFPPDEVREQVGRDVPVVMNEWGHGEIFGGPDEPVGVYTPEDVEKWRRTVETVREGGGYAFYHSHWKQHLREDGGPHFEIGPSGAQPQEPRGGEPSEHWYFDMVRSMRGL
ncbi:MAG: hypothetical protein R6X33_15715 [Candidatus Brocadiia bacterium]